MRDLSFNADARTYVFCLSQDNTVVTVPEVTMLMLRTKIILSMSTLRWELRTQHWLVRTITYSTYCTMYNIDRTISVLRSVGTTASTTTVLYTTYSTARMEGGAAAA